MTKARDLSNIISGGFTADDIPNLDASKITTGEIANARVADLPASKITSGTFANDRISESSVSQHATSFDDNKIVNDISTLALTQASNDNRSAYNTNSQFVDVFQDATGIDTETNTNRNTGEYVSTNTEEIGALSSSGVLLDTGSDNDRAESSVNNSSGNGYVAQKLYVAPKTKLIIETVTGYSYGVSGGSSGKQYFTTDNSGSLTNTPSSMGSVYWQINYSSTSSGSAIPYSDNGDFTIDNLDGTTNLPFWWVFNEAGGFATGLWRAKNTGSTTQGEYYNPSGDNTQTVLGASINSAIADGSGNTLDIQSDEVFALNIQGKYQTKTGAFNATGNFTGTTITAPSSVSSMGAIITYQDNAGTNALNTDIVLELSADNGSNWSTATLSALPNFSTGIKMAKVNDLAVTAGTQLKIQIKFC
jgi:hypothetical protein